MPDKASADSRRGFGSYRRINGDLWEIRYPTVNWSGLPGKRGSECVRGDEVDCERRLEQIRRLNEWKRRAASERAKERADPEAAATPTLCELFRESYLPYAKKTGCVARTTLDSYESIFRIYIAPSIGDVPMGVLSHEDVQTLLDSKSRSVAKHICSVVRMLYNYGQNKGLIKRESNVMADRYRFARTDRCRPAENVNRKCFDEETFAKVMAAARGRSFEGPVLLMGAGGCRPAEACGVDPRLVEGREIGGMLWALVPVLTDIVELHGRVYEDGVKTPKSRRIALVPDPYASRLLEICREKVREGDEYMAYDRVRGVPRAARSIRDEWQKWFATQPFEYIPPKNLRNTYATILFSKGVPPEAISMLLGHSSTSDMLYRHYARPTAEQSAELLARYLSPTSDAWNGAAAVPATAQHVPASGGGSGNRSRRPLADVANIRFSNAPDGMKPAVQSALPPSSTAAGADGLRADMDIDDIVLVAKVLKAMRGMES